jgi:leucyl-tRNA synthetase
VGDDIENFRFNTAISALMVLFNDLSKLPQVNKETFNTFLKLLHPFAPHLTEEIWQQQGHEGFLVKCAWPKANESLMQDDTQDIGVQVNGKVRDRILVPVGASREETEKMALSSEKVQRALEGFEIKKIIVVPGRMVSVVAAPKK